VAVDTVQLQSALELGDSVAYSADHAAVPSEVMAWTVPSFWNP
jgi:hypothetical protein